MKAYEDCTLDELINQKLTNNDAIEDYCTEVPVNHKQIDDLEYQNDLIDDMVEHIKNHPKFLNAAPTMDTSKWTYSMLQED
jgi:ssDNA-specific exonuclease RecJ